MLYYILVSGGNPNDKGAKKMKKQLVKRVKGHCATWEIFIDADDLYCVCGKRYGTFERAVRAIRIAEHNYLEDNPNAPVANTDVWADHGVLWVDDNDGGYYD